MPVVEPESRCADEDGPVAGVLGSDRGRRAQESSPQQGRQLQESRQLHGGLQASSVGQGATVGGEPHQPNYLSGWPWRRAWRYIISQAAAPQRLLPLTCA